MMRQCLIILVFIVGYLYGCAEPKEKQPPTPPVEKPYDTSNSLVFAINGGQVKDLPVKDFNDSKEFAIRRGLPNFFKKCQQGKAITIGYIGGSITRAETQYRTQSANYISSMFPNAIMRGVNAGVSGTDADLGAYRVGEQILAAKPDLVFIEFAVNGGHPGGTEGIIRQIIKDNPTTDICLIYTIMGSQIKSYVDGSMPAGITRLERIAVHYNIPSIHLGLYPSMLQRDGKLVGTYPASNGEIVLTIDGTHPTTAGGDLYASSIARAFEAMKDNIVGGNLSLIAPLHEDNWENATMVEPSSLLPNVNNWSVPYTAIEPNVKNFADWFAKIYIAEENAIPLKFKFEGDIFGIFDIGGTDGCAINIEIDGKKISAKAQSSNGRVTNGEWIYPSGAKTSLLRFNAYCNDRYRGQYEVIKLDAGVHTVEISVSDEKLDKAKILGVGSVSEKFDKQRFYLGRILLRGRIVK